MIFAFVSHSFHDHHAQPGDWWRVAVLDVVALTLLYLAMRIFVRWLEKYSENQRREKRERRKQRRQNNDQHSPQNSKPQGDGDS